MQLKGISLAEPACLWDFLKHKLEMLPRAGYTSLCLPKSLGKKEAQRQILSPTESPFWWISDSLKSEHGASEATERDIQHHAGNSNRNGGGKFW